MEILIIILSIFIIIGLISIFIPPFSYLLEKWDDFWENKYFDEKVLKFEQRDFHAQIITEHGDIVDAISNEHGIKLMERKK